MMYCGILKKNQNAPGPSEHSPVRGEKMSKRLGGIVRSHLLSYTLVVLLLWYCTVLYTNKLPLPILLDNFPVSRLHL